MVKSALLCLDIRQHYLCSSSHETEHYPVKFLNEAHVKARVKCA